MGELEAADPPRGRPRDEERDTALCEAAIALVAEVGYDRMSMDAVAARAHASKATLYRRWDSKAALVADALRCRHTDPAEPLDTGDVRGDLLLMLRRMVDRVRSTDLELMAALMGPMRRDPELARLLRAQIVETKQQASREWTARCVARGQLPPGTDPDLVHQVAPPMVFHRLLLTGEPVDEAFLTHVVDDVLLPLLRPAPPASPDPARKDLT